MRRDRRRAAKANEGTMSNKTLEYFRREREAFMQRSTSNTDERFRLWLRSVFKDSPELVSDAVADFIAERLSARGKP